MGGGFYSSMAYSAMSDSRGYKTASASQIFTSRRMDPQMDPKEANIRESRDGPDHPESVAIIVALDVTGSMGDIPMRLIREDFPKMMDAIIQRVKDPQILFMGIGDYSCDAAPLQVGQFESSTEMLTKWLTTTWLEGGGGGNSWESYSMAWLFASRHTAIDCLEKRGQKGILITIGDEPLNPEIPGEIISRYTTESQASRISSEDLYKEVCNKYHTFHINVEHVRFRDDVVGSWRQVVGQNIVTVQGAEGVAPKIAELVLDNVKHSFGTLASAPGTANHKPDDEEMML